MELLFQGAAAAAAAVVLVDVYNAPYQLPAVASVLPETVPGITMHIHHHCGCCYIRALPPWDVGMTVLPMNTVQQDH